MRRRLLLQSAVWGFAVWLGSGVSVALAQGQVSKTSSKDKDAETFFSHFSTIAKQNHVVIVAEDVPLHLSLSQDEEKAFAEAEKMPSLQKRIAQEAALFDYESRFIAPNLFVLRKKFTDPSDLPFVTWDEAVGFLEMANRFLIPFKSPFKYGLYNNSPKFLQAMASLTDAQLALMKEAKLPVASLSPAQREQIWYAVLTQYIDNYPLAAVQRSLFDINTTQTTNGYFRNFTSRAEYPSPAGFASFCFVYPTPNDRYFKQAVLPLCYQKTERRLLHGTEIFFPKRDANGVETPFYDASEPNDADRIAAKEQVAAHADPTVYTLKALTEELTRSAAAKTVYVTDDALASKPVSLFGMENADAGAVFAACALAYELRTVKEEPNGNRLVRITTPLAAKPSSLHNMSKAIEHVWPGPYSRALHSREMNAVFVQARARTARNEQEEAIRAIRWRAQNGAVPSPPVPEAVLKQQAVEKEGLSAIWNHWRALPDTLEQAALRRFRATVEPKANATPEKRLAFSALDETEKSTLGTALMRFTLQQMNGYGLGPPPPYIERFGDVVLSGEPRTYNDQLVLDIYFGLIKPDGSFDSMGRIDVDLLPAKPDKN